MPLSKLPMYLGKPKTINMLAMGKFVQTNRKKYLPESNFESTPSKQQIERIRNSREYEFTKVTLNEDMDSFSYSLSSLDKFMVGPIVSNYLENYKICPGLEEHKEFVVSKIYNSWPKVDAKWLVPYSLEKYFKEVSIEDVKDSTFLDSDSEKLKGVNVFKKAEGLLLEKKVKFLSMTHGVFLPYPKSDIDGNFKELEYIIYDKKSVPEDEELIQKDLEKVDA